MNIAERADRSRRVSILGAFDSATTYTIASGSVAQFRGRHRDSPGWHGARAATRAESHAPVSGSHRSPRPGLRPLPRHSMRDVEIDRRNRQHCPSGRQPSQIGFVQARFPSASTMVIRKYVPRSGSTSKPALWNMVSGIRVSVRSAP